MDEQTPYSPPQDEIPSDREVPTEETPVTSIRLEGIGEYILPVDKPKLLPDWLITILEELPIWNRIKMLSNKTVFTLQGSIAEALGKEDLKTHWRIQLPQTYSDLDRRIVVVASSANKQIFTYNLNDINTHYDGGTNFTERPVTKFDQLSSRVGKLLGAKDKIPYRDIDAEIKDDSIVIMIKYRGSKSEIQIYSNDASIVPNDLTIEKDHWEKPKGKLLLPSKDIAVRNEHVELLLYLKPLLPTDNFDDVIRNNFLIVTQTLDKFSDKPVQSWEKPNFLADKELIKRSYFEEWYLKGRSDDTLIIKVNNEHLVIRRKQIYEPSQALLSAKQKTEQIHQSTLEQHGNAYSIQTVMQKLSQAQEIIIVNTSNVAKPEVYMFTNDNNHIVDSLGPFSGKSIDYFNMFKD